MREIRPPNPELEAKRLKKMAESTIKSLSDAIFKSKSEWLDSCMKKILPPRLYNVAKSGKPAEKEIAAIWVERQGIKIQEHPDRTVIVRGEHVISQFRFKIEDGKIAVQVTPFKAHTEQN